MPSRFDVVCLSHLRWDFVYQRPQHLLSRCAREHRVFVIEEPPVGEGAARLAVNRLQDGPWVVVPHLPLGLPADTANARRGGTPRRSGRGRLPLRP